MHDYITILSDTNYFPPKALQLASLLANGFRKEICFLSFISENEDKKTITEVHQSWMTKTTQPSISVIRKDSQSALHDTLNEIEASFLIIELSPESVYHKTQPVLNLCKPLRIPYFIVNQATTTIQLQRVIVPIGFLTEEKEKGIFASKLARFCNSSITLLKAKDYGSRATRSVNQIQNLFEKLGLSCNTEQARKDSFKVQQEASLRACNGEADLIIIIASREYGLDDVIFGPPEQKIIKSARVPVMIINPRPDLYVLCD